MRPTTQCERCALRSYQKVEDDCAGAYGMMSKLSRSLEEMLAFCDVPFGETYEQVINSRTVLMEYGRLIGKSVTSAHQPAND